MDWEQTALVASAFGFAAVVFWRSRPIVSGVVSADGRAARAALRAAQERAKAANDDEARSIALCDAGDAAARLGKVANAVGFYLRASRTHPKSVVVVERSAVTFARRPGALENLMWRHLGHEDVDRAAALAALRVLGTIYAKKKRTAPRARAIENVVALSTVSTVSSVTSGAISPADGG